MSTFPINSDSELSVELDNVIKFYQKMIERGEGFEWQKFCTMDKWESGSKNFAHTAGIDAIGITNVSANPLMPAGHSSLKSWYNTEYIDTYYDVVTIKQTTEDDVKRMTGRSRMAEMVKMLRDGHASSIENDIINKINLGSTVTLSSVDQLPLFSLLHTIANGQYTDTIPNYITDAPAYGSCLKARRMPRAFKNDAGQFIGKKAIATHALCSSTSDNYDLLVKVKQNAFQPDSASKNENLMRASFDIIDHPGLDADNIYFTSAALKDCNKFAFIELMEKAESKELAPRVLNSFLFSRVKFIPVDWRAWYAILPN